MASIVSRSAWSRSPVRAASMARRLRMCQRKRGRRSPSAIRSASSRRDRAAATSPRAAWVPMSWSSASQRPLGIVLPLGRRQRLLLDVEPRFREALAPVEGGPGRGQDDVEGGPVPDGPGHLQRLGRELASGDRCPLPTAARRRSRTGAELERATAHRARRRAPPRRGRGPPRRRSRPPSISRSGARIRAARARRWGSPRVRATSAAAKTVGRRLGSPALRRAVARSSSRSHRSSRAGRSNSSSRPRARSR